MSQIFGKQLKSPLNVTSSFAITASFALNGGTGGSGFPFSGSAVITGSLLVSESGIVVTGSVRATSFTGSLFGTASYVTGSIFTSTNPALSASFAVSASRAVSASFATTASYAFVAQLARSVNLNMPDGRVLFSDGGFISSNSTFKFQSGYLVLETNGINRGSNNIGFGGPGGTFFEGVGNYDGLGAYSFTGATAGVITIETYDDISGQIGDYVVIQKQSETFSKVYKVSSTSYIPGNLGPGTLTITLEDATFSGNGYLGSLLTRSLTSYNYPIGADVGYKYAHGENNTTIGNSSIAIGNNAVAVGHYSYAQGLYTITDDSYQTVIGQYNLPLDGQSAFIIGNGTDNLNRSNLLYVSESRIQITGSLSVTGSATISDVITLPYRHPLPESKPTGSIALSGSGATFVGMFMYNGTSWVKLSV